VKHSLLAFSLLVIGLVSFFLLRPILVEGEDAGKAKKPRFTATAKTIRDNRSGLMWSLNGNFADLTYSQKDAFEFIGEVNRDRFAGYQDWRLPSREEMLSIVQYAQEIGYRGQSPDRTVAAGLRNAGITNVQPNEYWSSTVNLYNSSEAWYVNFRDGSPGTGDKTLYLSVWPVRTAE
jgi:hypothetical protein